MQKDVSIIIPVKNGGDRFISCIESVQEARLVFTGSSEVVIVDNGSTDQTVSIAKSNNLNVFIKPDLTIAGLRNFGAEKSTGEICAFIDSDIVVDKFWLVNAMRYFDKNHIVCVGASSFPPEDATWVSKASFLFVEYRGEKSTSRKWLASSNMFVRRDIFQKLGGFNVELTTCEDVDFGYRLSDDYSIIYDMNIKTIHLGEIQTINELLRKELWRGQDSLKSFFLNGFKLEEFPSIMIPLYHLLILIIMFSSIFFDIRLSIISLILIILPSIALTLLILIKLKKINMFLKLTVVTFVYYFARALALLKGILLIMNERKSHV